MSSSLDNFAFVLFRPKEPGNIGAAARALKNMNLGDLRLVAPRRLYSRRATAMAVHGDDVLAAARVYPDLSAALGDRTLVIGTTARTGLYRRESRAIRDLAPELVNEAAVNRIALVFGPEDFGLTNEELKHCQRLATIPAAPAYSSLNLAQAVLIVAYELMLAAGAGREVEVASALAPVTEVDTMLSRIADALVAIGFLPASNPDHIMFTLRAIFGRSGLKPREVDILNGIARQIRWCAEGGNETLAAKRRDGKPLR